MTNNVFEKILYGLKVANDNIIVMNEKIDNLIGALSYEEEPKEDAGPHERIGDLVI